MPKIIQHPRMDHPKSGCISMKKIPPRFLVAVCCCAALVSFAGGCSTYPLDSGDRDLMELESVWQYLSTYSIYKDSIWKDRSWEDPIWQNDSLKERIPREDSALLAFNTPEALLLSVEDTLHGLNYTTYNSPQQPQKGLLAVDSSSTPDTTVFLYRLSSATARLYITHFKSNDTTYHEFKNMLPSLVQYQNIIVDLRGNGGGDIAAVDSIMEYFLPLNTPYISAQYRKYDEDTRIAVTVPWEQWTTKHEHTPTLSGKHVAVLINGHSASAAEIMAAGLKDGRAAAGKDTVALIGEKTYGKGMGQIIVPRGHLNKKDLKITFLMLRGLIHVGKYHRKGISPDYPVTDFRAQINTALRVLEPFALLSKTPVAPPLSNAAAVEGSVYIHANPLFEK
jgi:hypothetical protein